MVVDRLLAALATVIEDTEAPRLLILAPATVVRGRQRCLRQETASARQRPGISCQTRGTPIAEQSWMPSLSRSPLVLILVLTSTAAACTSPTTGSSSEGSSVSKKNESGSTTTDEARPTARAPTTLEGTWDLSSDGLAPSSLTISGGKFSGVLVFADEGREDGLGCLVAERRIVIDVVTSGDEASGSLTVRRTNVGTDCTDSVNRAVPLAATRKAKTTAEGGTPFEGKWAVTLGEGADRVPFALSVAGMVARLLDDAHPDSVVTTTLSSGAATTVHSDGSFSVAARKR